jgi:hypothetical protein
MRGQPGFFDVDDRLKRLSDLGDQLEGFRSAADFELFRPELNAALAQFVDEATTRCRPSWSKPGRVLIRRSLARPGGREGKTAAILGCPVLAPNSFGPRPLDHT